MLGQYILYVTYFSGPQRDLYGSLISYSGFVDPLTKVCLSNKSSLKLKQAEFGNNTVNSSTAVHTAQKCVSRSARL